jgi:hypothetical protein
MKRRIPFLSLICLVLGISSVFAQDAKEKRTDTVQILSVSAESPVRDGVQNEFTVQIQYFLDTADEALLAIGFNSDDPGRYHMTGSKRVIRGTNVITLKGRVIPKDWKERGDFIVYVNLSPYPIPKSRWRPLATTQRVIEFEP